MFVCAGGCTSVNKVSLPSFGFPLCAQRSGTWLFGVDWLDLRVCARSQTKYPSLTSSGVAAALLTLSLGLGPPPRLKMECTVLQSREEECLLV